ncbi:MAG TPA: 4-(cytidine 5'-diphospho)-2-C-methyl-D-erythritol kinase, partial [Candidatus Gemmiger avicola]|nr:4-(cytidine 5'-diphospho)-2-C-methyl-D-erythritol kinase [Candidatus Gemmiger avicola]
GTCRVRGVGDLLKPLPPCPDCRFVVVMPSIGVSTPEAFQRYDQMGSPVHPDCERQEAAVRAGDLAAICAAAGNALEHCSGAQETPAICAKLNEHGALTSQMTGSGAAVFGVFGGEDAARAAVQALQGSYKQVYLCRPVRGGAQVLPEKAARP